MGYALARTGIVAVVSGSLLVAGCVSPYDAQPNRYPSNQSYQSAPQYNQYSQAGQYNQSPQYAPSDRQSYNGRGVIEAIDVIQGENKSRGIAGALVGGVLGGILGHQIGHGSGNTAATVGGAVGGAVVGNQVEQRNSQGGATYDVRIRMNDNGYQTINLSNPGDLRVGDRVRIDNGQISRIN
ncbi:glycine zipper 2TM domain-containing protein [Glaciimonas immobilis]|nr:glycine zipper 2TM domain-containing protein [Glaciimonas immobilis]